LLPFQELVVEVQLRCGAPAITPEITDGYEIRDDGTVSHGIGESPRVRLREMDPFFHPADGGAQGSEPTATDLAGQA
jgi:hypothetical protein